MAEESRILKFLPNKQFGKRIAALAGHSLIGQMVSLAILPLLTRLCSSTAIGQLGLFLSFLNFVAVTSCLRFDVGIVTTDSKNTALDVSFLCLLINPFMSLCYALIFFLLIKNQLLGFGHLTYFAIPLIFVAILITGCTQVFRYLHVREANFKLVGHASTKQNIVRALSQVFLAIAGMSYVGLILGDLLGRIIGLKQLFRHFFHTVKEVNYKFNFNQILQIVRANKTYPIYSLPSSIINTLAFTLPIPLLAQSYGLKTAGLYTLVGRVLAIPAYFIGRNIADVFHSQAADYLRNNQKELKKLFMKTTRLLFTIGFIPFLLCAAASPWAFRYIFGSAWADAGFIAAIISPWAFAQFVISPVSRVVFVTGKQPIKLIYDFLALFAIIAGITIGKHFGYTPLATIALMSGLSIGAYIVYFSLLYFSVNSFLKQMDSS